MRYRTSNKDYPTEVSIYEVNDGVLRYSSDSPMLCSGVENIDMVTIEDNGNNLEVRLEGVSGYLKLDYDMAEKLLVALIEEQSKVGTTVERFETNKIL